MADRILDRAFNRVYGSTYSKTVKPPVGKQEQKQEEEKDDDEGDAEKEVKHILAAWKGKDYFGLLRLPHPTIDALGRPTWSCSKDDVSRAYRKSSRLVHPDKSHVQEARAAFEALSQAHRELKDANKLESILKAAAEKAKEEAARQEARATVTERIQLNAAKNVQARSLRAQEGSCFRDKIVQQMRKRQQDLTRKQQARSHRWKEEPLNSDHNKGAEPPRAATPAQRNHTGGGSESEDERVVRLKKRKKPTFI